MNNVLIGLALTQSILALTCNRKTFNGVLAMFALAVSAGVCLAAGLP